MAFTRQGWCRTCGRHFTYTTEYSKGRVRRYCDDHLADHKTEMATKRKQRQRAKEKQDATE